MCAHDRTRPISQWRGAGRLGERRQQRGLPQDRGRRDTRHAAPVRDRQHAACMDVDTCQNALQALTPCMRSYAGVAMCSMHAVSTQAAAWCKGNHELYDVVTFSQEPEAVGGGALLAQVMARLQRHRLHAAGQHQPRTRSQRLHRQMVSERCDNVSTDRSPWHCQQRRAWAGVGRMNLSRMQWDDHTWPSPELATQGRVR